MAKGEVVVAAAAAASKAKEAKAKEAQKAKTARESKIGNDTTKQRAQDGDLPQDLDDWELSKGGLPAGSALSGSKALLDEYPDDEANSKKTQKTNTGKGKKGNPKTKE